MAIVSDVEIRLFANLARLQTDMAGARRTVETAVDGMSKAVDKFKGLLAGLGVGLGLSEITKQMLEAQREFDKLNSALITATGSTSNAKQAFAALQKFAATTPYDLKQVTEAFLKLRNLGLTPSERALKSYGNTAGAMGKDLNQMVEAVADATTGEFERLKEFGIKAQQNGDTVRLTFQGVTKTIGNNATEIEKYLLNLGETKFAGGMELQAKTLDGAISNLADTWQATMRTFSQSGFGDATQTAVLGLTDALTNLQYITKAVAGEAAKAGDNLSSVSTVSKALTTVFETVAVLGANVWYVLEQTGKELGGLAAQAVSVLKGDFAGAAAIGRMMKEEAAAARKDIDERTAAILNASETRKKVEAEEAKDTTDKLARYRVVTDGQKVATQAALDFYKKTVEGIQDTLKQFELERDGVTDLTTEEKKRVEILGDLARAGKTLSNQQKEDIRGYADAIVLAGKYNAQLKAEREARSALIQDANQQVKAAEQQTRALEDQVKFYGLTEEAVLSLKAAEMARQLQNENLDAIERGRLEGLLEETQNQITLQKQLTKMKGDTQFWTDLEDAAHQTFLSIQNGSKDLWTRMKDTAKNLFFEWLYQMTLKKWIIDIGFSAGGTSAVSGIAGAAAQTAGGSLLGTAGSLAGIASAVSGLGGALAGGAGWLTGSTTLSGALTAGTSLLGTGTVAGGIAGAGVLAGAIAPIVVGLLGASTLWSKAFGMGAKNVTSTSLQGVLTPTGATASTVQTWTQKGGWFRSDKSGTDTSALDAAQTAAFASTYKAILDLSKTLGDTLGADTSALSTRVQQLNIDLTGLTDATAQQEAITKFFSGVSDTIATELVPNLAKFQQEGETLSTTLQRVATDYAAVDTALAAIGKSFGAVGVASITAREALITAAGGVDALGSSVAYFQQNFLTAAEQLAPVQSQVSSFLASIGQSTLATIDQYKQFALGIDTTTEAGAKLFAQVLAMAPAFKQVADAAAAAQKAAEDLAAAQAAAVAKQLADNETALRAGVEAAFSRLEEAVSAQKDVLAKAYEETISGIEATITSLGTSIDATKALADALKSGIVSTSTPGATTASQLAARAQIAQALADAKRTGVLPSADSLSAALSTVSKVSADQFGSLLEYQRAVARTNSDIAELGGVTDKQLTTQERQLAALQSLKDSTTAAYNAQLERLDAVLAYNKMMSNIALGSYNELLSVNAGIATVAAAIQALKQGATTSNPTGTGLTIEGLYQSVLGRAPDAAGYAYWANVFGSSIDAGDYANFVQGAQAELAAKGTSWQTNANYSTSSTSSDAVAAAVADLTAQMASMQTSMARTANATQQLAQQFDTVSAGGNALITENV
jgi:hypothetical protein